MSEEARGPIERLTLTNFKAHRETVLSLKPLTLFVGPNGSGKTSALEAIYALGQLYFQDFDAVFNGERHSQVLIRHGAGVEGFRIAADGWSAGEPRSIELDVSVSEDTDFDDDGNEYSRPREYAEFRLGRGEAPDQRKQISYNGRSLQWEGFGHEWPELRTALLLRLDSRQIAAPSAASVTGRVRVNGGGVATAIAHLQLESEARVKKVVSDLRRIVPQVAAIRPVPTTIRTRDRADEAGYHLVFDFDGANDIPASGVSEGTLIALALVTLLNGPTRPRVLLLDDINEALHPSAQLRLMALLTELTTGPNPIQVIATSHSPYILDAVAPDAVQVFALRDDGTVAVKPLSQHPMAAEYRGALSTGQLWTLDDEHKWVVEGEP